MILPKLISEVREDIRSRISKLKAEGVTEFGFFGSSLGSFILYNCIGREIPELVWGAFSTRRQYRTRCVEYAYAETAACGTRMVTSTT